MTFKEESYLKIESLLPSDEIHIWSLHKPSYEKEINYFLSILSEDERQKSRNFKFPEDQKSFIISRGILRCLLRKYLEHDPQDIEIIYGLWGKPYLVENPLYFNLSHSKDHVLYALTNHYEVGVDIEYINEAFDSEDMVLNLLSPQELGYWKSISPEKKSNLFFKLWACKEAFLKASGKGWFDDGQKPPLGILEILKSDNKIYETTEKMRTPYCFESIPGYASALFIEGPFLQLKYFIW